jgi:hypothetical protein
MVFRKSRWRLLRACGEKVETGFSPPGMRREQTGMRRKSGNRFFAIGHATGTDRHAAKKGKPVFRRQACVKTEL